MKRILLVTIMLLFVGIIVFAQQAGASSLPTSAQTKQSAQQSLTEAKTNSSQFESTLDSLKTQITSNNNAATYRRLKGDIDRLEAQIKNAQANMQGEINLGHSVNARYVDDLQQLIDKHKAAMAELEAFASK
jgi:peptidoglycan hydrolase CwlO-like protein